MSSPGGLFPPPGDPFSVTLSSGSPNRRLITNGVPPPYDGFLSLRAQRKEPKERAPRTLRPKNRGPLARRWPQWVRTRDIPCPWPGRTRSLSCPFGPGLLLRPSLGLSKGVKKPNSRSGALLVCARGSASPGRTKISCTMDCWQLRGQSVRDAGRQAKKTP
jgi:hypothetical protein